MFLKESNRGLLEWSSKIPNLSKYDDAELMAAEVDAVSFLITESYPENDFYIDPSIHPPIHQPPMQDKAKV